MKARIVIAVLVTLGIFFYKYKKDKDIKKLIIALISFVAIISLAVVGNLTRPVIPIFAAHIILIIISWGAVVYYQWSGKYYWWIIFSPVVTIALFLGLEYLTGSGHDLPLIS